MINDEIEWIYNFVSKCDELSEAIKQEILFNVNPKSLTYTITNMHSYNTHLEQQIETIKKIEFNYTNKNEHLTQRKNELIGRKCIVNIILSRISFNEQQV